MARLLITATYGHDNATRASMPFYVMGSAREPVEPTVAALSRRLGRAIAERRCCLLTGACPGLPHEAVLAAKELDGHIVGISPAATLREHVETFCSPYREYEVLIFTGLGLIPWRLSFSFARGLQGPALEAWRGEPHNVVGSSGGSGIRATSRAAAPMKVTFRRESPRLGIYAGWACAGGS